MLTSRTQTRSVLPSACVAGRAVNRSRRPPAEPACLTDHLVPDALAPRAADCVWVGAPPEPGFVSLSVHHPDRAPLTLLAYLSCLQPQATSHNPSPAVRHPPPTTHRPISPVLSTPAPHTYQPGRPPPDHQSAGGVSPSVPLRRPARRPARRAPGPERRRCTAH